MFYAIVYTNCCHPVFVLFLFFFAKMFDVTLHMKLLVHAKNTFSYAVLIKFLFISTTDAIPKLF